mmetsp:Transcript_136220/g.235777  ORF Transcript_136220/g.235777 Transcript_136220/m.235777 type:complete len:145 (-) Transcript_136220:2240-2674(-)
MQYGTLFKAAPNLMSLNGADLHAWSFFLQGFAVRLIHEQLHTWIFIHVEMANENSPLQLVNEHIQLSNRIEKRRPLRFQEGLTNYQRGAVFLKAAGTQDSCGTLVSSYTILEGRILTIYALELDLMRISSEVVDVCPESLQTSS